MKPLVGLAVACGLWGQTVVIVTGTFEPLALEEIDRAVTPLEVRGQALLFGSLTDWLRLDPSLDLRQRAPGGVQNDLSIRGASYAQTLVLLNGERLNDAQSGHHNLDIPVPLEAVSRLEVLRGAGSTLYGSDAVGGVVNIITAPPETTQFRLRGALGSFGLNQEWGSLAVRAGGLTEQLVFSRDFSTGFRPDRDYRNLALSSTTHFTGTDLTLGWRDQPFGADQFYGNFNSWERTRTHFASLRRRINKATTATFAWRRHTDLFVLYRDRPWVYTNRHAVESWSAAVRRSSQVLGAARLDYGVEGYRESISSSNLGNHSRQRGAAYASLDWRVLRRFSFTVGAREEVYRAVSGAFTPSASGGFWVSSRLKLRAGASRAFRVPSYTELYYHDPANVGSPGLRPERAWSYEGGVDWNPSARVRGQATVFHRRERDGIDYFRARPTDIWRAGNLGQLNFTGVEAALRVWGQAEARYTFLNGTQAGMGGLLAKYAFFYPHHAATVGWTGQLPGGLVARTRVGVTARRGGDAYAVWDLYAGRTRGRWHPFVQFTNLTRSVYQEVPGVAMPPRAIAGGLEVVVAGR